MQPYLDNIRRRMNIHKRDANAPHDTMEIN